MAVSRVNYSFSWAGYGIQNMTWTLTCPATTTGMFAWFTGNKNGAGDPQYVRWNGADLTLLQQREYSDYHGLYAMENPDIGTYNLVLRWDGAYDWTSCGVGWVTNTLPGDLWGSSAISIGGNAQVTTTNTNNIVLGGGTAKAGTVAVSGGDLTQWFQGTNNRICVGYKDFPNGTITAAFSGDTCSSAVVVNGANAFGGARFVI